MSTLADASIVPDDEPGYEVLAHGSGDHGGRWLSRTPRAVGVAAGGRDETSPLPSDAAGADLEDHDRRKGRSMTATTMLPTPLPPSRMLGPETEERRRMLACVDVVVGYVCARHRRSLDGWQLQAALVEGRVDFRGGETVAVRAAPQPGRSLHDLAPVPNGVLREIASRITSSLEGIANVVPDVASSAPDVDGLFLVSPDHGRVDDARSA